MSAHPINKQIRLCEFEMNCVEHLSPGMWKHPDDTRWQFNDVDFWVEEAQLLEHGLFDALFLADVLGTYETDDGDSESALRAAHQVPRNDPLLLIPALAMVTQHLGFIATISTTYEPPFSHAQRLSTVDHLTRGRVGWNIVTSYLNNAARNFGLPGQIEHDDRYDKADEFLDVCYKLWEGSWEDDAVLRDREHGVYTDPSKVHYIDHVGQHYLVAGPHLAEPSPQRSPVLFQATRSDRGKQFAGQHAEGVFLGSSTIEGVRDDIVDIRRRAVEAGREPNDVKIFSQMRVITGKTHEDVQNKVEDYAQYRKTEQRVGNLDLSRFDLNTFLDEIVLPDDGSGRGTNRNIFNRFLETAKGRPTLGEFVEWQRSTVARGPFTAIGTPDEIADEMERWMRDTDIDGFNFNQIVTPQSNRDFIELVIPVLQRRGLYRDRYDPREQTLRERLFGAGQSRIPDRHPGMRWRRAFSQELADAVTPS